MPRLDAVEPRRRRQRLQCWPTWWWNSLFVAVTNKQAVRGVYMPPLNVWPNAVACRFKSIGLVDKVRVFRQRKALSHVAVKRAAATSRERQIATSSSSSSCAWIAHGDRPSDSSTLIGWPGSHRLTLGVEPSCPPVSQRRMTCIGDCGVCLATVAAAAAAAMMAAVSDRIGSVRHNHATRCPAEWADLPADYYISACLNDAHAASHSAPAQCLNCQGRGVR